jgi:hypothetical protein
MFESQEAGIGPERESSRDLTGSARPPLRQAIATAQRGFRTGRGSASTLDKP